MPSFQYRRNILALLLAFVASGANAEEIQPDADASQSVAGSDRSDVADTTQSVLSVDGDQMHADISDFLIVVGLIVSCQRH